MPFAYSYCRVSDEKQAASKGGTGISEEEQRQANLEFYERVLKPMGIVWSDTPFEDAAVSASKRKFAERPAGRQLLRVLRPGDHLVVAKSSRAFRNMQDCLNTEAMLRSYGVTVHCLDLPLDTTSNATARFSRNILAAVDQWYSDQLSERMLSLASHFRKTGRVTGGCRGRKLYGYFWNEDNTLTPDPVERQVMEWVMHEIHFGLGMYERILKRLLELEKQGALVLSRVWKVNTVAYCKDGFYRLVEREGVDWIQNEELREFVRKRIGPNGKRIGATALG